jgi:hypothetical protein
MRPKSKFAPKVARRRHGSLTSMAQFAVERYGRLEILHNNVGFGTPSTAETVGPCGVDQRPGSSI